MSTLHDRCRTWIERQYLEPAPIAAVEDLASFVLAEIARGSAPQLGEGKPLVLFFASDDARDDFLTVWRSAHPVAKTIKVEP